MGYFCVCDEKDRKSFAQGACEEAKEKTVDLLWYKAHYVDLAAAFVTGYYEFL
jgi:hypothetical protein